MPIHESNQPIDLLEIAEELLEAQKKELIKEKRREEMMEGPEGEEKRNFRDYDQSQIYYVAVQFREFLEPEHPARVIDAVIERIDLSEIYESYSEEGNPPYHPKMMLKVLFYAYHKGVMSCRQIWDALEHRSDFIFLSAGQVPNFRTVNAFRLRHLGALPQLFAQIVFMCVQLGMVDLGYLAIDGQKIQANASFRKSKNLKGLEKEYRKVRGGIKKLVEKEVSEDFPLEVQQKRLGRLEEKAAELEEFQKELEALGDEEKRLNMSDEDAPVMRHKDGRSLSSYNHQSATDSKYGVVCAVGTTQNSDQPGDLLPLVDKAKENTGGEHKQVVADSGFADYEVLEKVEEERSEDFYLPDRRYEASQKKPGEKGKLSKEQFERKEDGSIVCPAGHVMEYKRTTNYEDGHQMHDYEGTLCKSCALHDRCTKRKTRIITIDSREKYRDSMREKLSSERGREVYMKRQGLAEPLHGDDQRNKGWKQHHLRGLEKAAGEFLLIRIATNLGKMIRYRSPEILSPA